MAETIFRSTFRLLLLLTVVVLVAAGSKNEQPSLEEVSNFSTTPKIVDDSKIVTTGTRTLEAVKSSTTGLETVSKTEELSWGEVGDEEPDDNDGDEYEEELRGMAESHETVSRDDRRNVISASSSSSSSSSGIATVIEDRDVGDRHSGITVEPISREKNLDSPSNENTVSKEAITEDEEVAELLKYKQKVTTTLTKKDVVGDTDEPGSKVKRVPTVKKELSTQKEIIATNETRLLPKNVISNVEVVNRLDDESKIEGGYSGTVNGRDSNRYELVRGNMGPEDEYEDVDTPGDILRRLDKRRPTGLNDPGSRFLGVYGPEQEQQLKLRELGIEEASLAESLMELLSRLAEDPRRWERMHRLFHDVEQDLEIARNPLVDSEKRGNSENSILEIPTIPSTTETSTRSSTTNKPKKKKKKKKPRNRDSTKTTTTTTSTSTTEPTTFTTTPTTSISLAPALLTTTQSSWPTTTSQWRLVAQRLFGSPWSNDLRNFGSSSLAKVRYSTGEKIDDPKSTQDRSSRIDDKQRATLNALNNERQALMLQTAREYSQPRRHHYGKVNTHEKGSPDVTNDDLKKNWDTDFSSRIVDYDIPQRDYHRQSNVDRQDRYGQYERSRSLDYSMNSGNRHRSNDYDDDLFRFDDGDSTNRGGWSRSSSYGASGRELVGGRKWPISRYDYSRSWNNDGRTDRDDNSRSVNNWGWRSYPNENWMTRYRPWSRGDNYRQLSKNVDDVDDDVIVDDVTDYGDKDDRRTENWRYDSARGNWRDYSENSRWPMNRENVGPTWNVDDRSKTKIREPIFVDSAKNRSEIGYNEKSEKSSLKDKSSMRKITMKAWNSLTSDPATWPFKMHGVKPWPKDKNGKSYNPNAALVRKLGLDKPNRSSIPTIGKNEIVESSNYKNANVPSTRTNSLEMENLEITPVKNSITWPEKLNSIDDWEIGKTGDRENSAHVDETRGIWRVNGDDKVWSGKSSIGSKSSSSSSSSSSIVDLVVPGDRSSWKSRDVKNPAYGQLSDGPRIGWNDRENSPDAARETWPSRKIDDDWTNRSSDRSAEKSVTVNDRGSGWPSKWRQFAYHKVTAAPIVKPGSSSANDGNGRARNSYIAVSAVTGTKYSNGEWRKNDVEDTSQNDRDINGRSERFDRDDPSSQLRKIGSEQLWNQQRGNDGNEMERNGDEGGRDPLEHELSALRRKQYWEFERLRQHNRIPKSAKEVSTTTEATIETSSRRANATTIADDKRQAKKLAKNSDTDAQVQQKKDITK